jgi:Fe2+ or Zn2+ uptake regulation protein
VDKMLNTLITSKTRLKLLTKFFLNPQAKAYLRGLEESFGESSNAVRVELNRFESAGLLNSTMEGNRKVYTANTNHPLYPDIHSILCKHIGIDHIIEEVTKKLGQIEQVWLSGEFAKGNDSTTIDLLLVGTSIDQEYLEELRAKAAILINRSIKLTLYTSVAFAEMKKEIQTSDIFLLWDAKTK